MQREWTVWVVETEKNPLSDELKFWRRPKSKIVSNKNLVS